MERKARDEKRRGAEEKKRRLGLDRRHRMMCRGVVARPQCDCGRDRGMIFTVSCLPPDV
jgi:hypothetical protein